MPVKNTTTAQFNPAGMNALNTITPQMQSMLSDMMANPLSSSYFNTQLQMANKNIGQQGQSQMATLMNNMRQMGGASNPFMMSQAAMQGRNQSGQQSNAFNNLLMGAQQNRMWATGTAAGYRPLQTGQTQQMSGLGTWLPQVIGGGLGFLTGGGIGALKSAFGGGSGGGSGGNNPFMSGGFNQPTPAAPLQLPSPTMGAMGANPGMV